MNPEGNLEIALIGPGDLDAVVEGPIGGLYQCRRGQGPRAADALVADRDRLGDHIGRTGYGSLERRPGGLGQHAAGCESRDAVGMGNTELAGVRVARAVGIEGGDRVRRPVPVDVEALLVVGLVHPSDDHPVGVLTVGGLHAGRRHDVASRADVADVRATGGLKALLVEGRYLVLVHHTGLDLEVLVELLVRSGGAHQGEFPGRVFDQPAIDAMTHLDGRTIRPGDRDAVDEQAVGSLHSGGGEDEARPIIAGRIQDLVGGVHQVHAVAVGHARITGRIVVGRVAAGQNAQQ